MGERLCIGLLIEYRQSHRRSSSAEQVLQAFNRFLDSGDPSRFEFSQCLINLDVFGKAHALAGGLARRLKDEFGLQPGDRVGLWLKNCPEFVFSLFGILLAEGVVVSINNFLTPFPRPSTPR